MSKLNQYNGKEWVEIKGDVGPRGSKGESIIGPQGIRGERGIRGEKGESIIGPKGNDGKDGSPDSPDEVVEKVNKATKKIKASAIENLEKTFAVFKENIKAVSRQGGGQSGGGDVVVAGTGITVTRATGGKRTISTASSTNTIALNYELNGGGATILTGIAGDITIPFACTITEAILLADQSGSIVVDIWKDTYANYPPTVADTITASAKPTLSSATKSKDTTLTGWTTTIAAGSTLRFNVDSVTTLTRCLVSLTVVKT